MRFVSDRKLVKTRVGVETGARRRLYEGISSCLAAASYRLMCLPNNTATSIIESQIISKLLITPDFQHRMVPKADGRCPYHSIRACLYYSFPSIKYFELRTDHILRAATTWIAGALFPMMGSIADRYAWVIVHWGVLAIRMSMQHIYKRIYY